MWKTLPEQELRNVDGGWLAWAVALAILLYSKPAY